MTIYVPGWMQGGSYSAKQDRINSAASLWDEGVNSRADLKVVQRAAGANMTVDIGTGGGVVAGDDQVFQGNYDFLSDATGSVSGFVATSANQRYDLVGVQINDPDAGGAAGSNAVFARVAGTQSATPTPPAVPNSFLLLAVIGPFTTSTTSITNSMIHDAYTGTGPTLAASARLCKGIRDQPGTIKNSLNAVPPNGWLICAGQAVSRTSYAALFEHFGTTFGAGDGSTTFNLPDYRGRVHVALDNQGGSDAGRLTVANTLGGAGGEETHALTVAELASHTHDHQHRHHPTPAGISPQVFAGSLSTANFGTDYTSGQVTVAATTTGDVNNGITTTATGSGTAHNNMPPYILGYTFVRT